MPAGKTLAAATFGWALSAGVVPVAAQIQQSESSVQSAVRDLRDRTPRASPSTSRRALTGTPSAMTPPRPEERLDGGRPEPGACALQDGKPCRK
jgi:hypothetical protein